VGITGYSNHVNRIEQIASAFRERNIPVVCGGPGVTIDPARWRPFSDVVIIGEAERIWPQFLNDFLRGDYQGEYRDDEKFDLNVTPCADYSAISPQAMGQYQAAVLQTSRGCPFNCEFCDAIIYTGRKTRYRPVEVILQEFDLLYSRGIRYIFLGDDNFSAHRKKAKRILQAIGDWNRAQKRPMILATALTIDTAKDDEFLRLAARAGLTRVFVGLESVNRESLKESNKKINLRNDPYEAVKKFQQYGIVVLGGCMVGFDHDDLTIFEQQHAFFSELAIANVFVIPVHAADATPLKARMIKEGRYIDYQKKSHDRPIDIFNTFTIIPKQMTVEQLQQGAFWLGWKLYQPAEFLGRMERFFNVFETSPYKKDGMEIPNGIDANGLKMVAKIALYASLRAPAWERSLFWKSLRLARHSSHPQRWEIAVSGFLFLVNARRILLAANPQITQIQYPS
ncbi:MAG: radical SAM protein, partial [Proteobacteria bacterium]|nr:radical SAM protein [Pseudomonadota bacterium]